VNLPQRNDSIQGLIQAIIGADPRFQQLQDGSLIYFETEEPLKNMPRKDRTCPITIYEHKTFFRSSVGPKYSIIMNDLRIAPFSAVLIGILDAWAESTSSDPEEAHRSGMRIGRMLVWYHRRFPEVEKSQEKLVAYRVKQLNYLLEQYFLVERQHKTIDSYVHLGLLSPEDAERIHNAPEQPTPLPYSRDNNQLQNGQRTQSNIAQRNGHLQPPRKSGQGPRAQLNQPPENLQDTTRAPQTRERKPNSSRNDPIQQGNNIINQQLQLPGPSHLQRDGHQPIVARGDKPVKLKSIFMSLPTFPVSSQAKRAPHRPVAEKPKPIPYVAEAAHATVKILRERGYIVAVFGSLACYTYGANRMPHVRILPLNPL
jgi:hypothetical protein